MGNKSERLVKSNSTNYFATLRRATPHTYYLMGHEKKTHKNAVSAEAAYLIGEIEFQGLEETSQALNLIHRRALYKSKDPLLTDDVDALFLVDQLSNAIEKYRSDKHSREVMEEMNS